MKLTFYDLSVQEVKDLIAQHNLLNEKGIEQVMNEVKDKGISKCTLGNDTTVFFKVEEDY